MKKLCKNCKHRTIKISRKPPFKTYPCNEPKSILYGKDVFEHGICDYWEAKVIGNGE